MSRLGDPKSLKNKHLGSLSQDAGAAQPPKTAFGEELEGGGTGTCALTRRHGWRSVDASPLCHLKGRREEKRWSLPGSPRGPGLLSWPAEGLGV